MTLNDMTQGQTFLREPLIIFITYTATVEDNIVIQCFNFIHHQEIKSKREYKCCLYSEIPLLCINI